MDDDARDLDAATEADRAHDEERDEEREEQAERAVMLAREDGDQLGWAWRRR